MASQQQTSSKQHGIKRNGGIGGESNRQKRK